MAGQNIYNRYFHLIHQVISKGQKVLWLFSISFIVLFSVKAQVSPYVFTQFSGTYVPGFSAVNPTPAAAFPSSWDDQTTQYNFLFPFYYNGVVYNSPGTIGVHADGWICFNTAAPAFTGTGAGGSWVSKTDPTGMYLQGSANNNGVAVFNADLREQAFSTFTGDLISGSGIISNISSFTNLQIGTRLSGSGIPDGSVVRAIDIPGGTITMTANATANITASTITPRSSIYGFVRGTNPNREFVIQWTQVRRYNTVLPESISFQVILKQAGNVSGSQTVEIVWGPCSSSIATALNVQCGLRGSSSADFNARTGNTDWASSNAATANTQTMSFHSGMIPTLGQTYRWRPCVSAPGAAGAISGSNNVCVGNSVTYSIAAQPNAFTYNWTYSGTGAGFSASTTVPSNTFSFPPGATGGTITVTPVNICGSGATGNLAVNVYSIPSASISYSSPLYCSGTSGPVPVVISGTAGGSFSASPAGLTLDPVTGTITPASSLRGSYTITYTYSNSGFCTQTTSTSVKIYTSLAGTYTVGTGGDFNTLTEAVHAYNFGCLSGPVQFSLIQNLYAAGETFPIEFQKNPFVSNLTPLTIQPTLSGNTFIQGSADSNAVIRILGDHIIFNGSFNNTTSRNLVLRNLAGFKPRVILMGSLGTTPVTNITIQNCLIQNGTTDAGAILCSDLGTIAGPGYFNNIKISNNRIRNSLYGIYFNAAASGTNGSGLEIISNEMNEGGALSIQYCGIYVRGANGVDIIGNQLANFRGTDDASDNGIWIASSVRNLRILKNIITNLNYTGTAAQGPRGIFISSGVLNANILIANNMIANLSGDGSDYTNALNGMNNPIGILLNSGTNQSGIRIYHNSIYLGGVAPYTNTLNQSNAVSSCIRIRGISYTDIRNNILVNRLGRAASAGLGSNAIMSSVNDSALFTGLNHNIYDIDAVPNGGTRAFGMMGGLQYGSFAGWKAKTLQDQNSINAFPVFVSPTDLRLDPASNNSIHNLGQVLAEVPGDLDEFTRNPITPDIGCDEFLPTGFGSWIGKVSTDWSVPSNWEDNRIPDAVTDATIQGAYPFLPTISGNFDVRNISLIDSGTPPLLTLSSTGKLRVFGNMNYSGAARIQAELGTLDMAGGAPQTIPDGIFVNNTIKSLLIENSDNAGVTLGGALNITGSLEFTATGKVLNTAGFLTLRSTATETARVGNLTGKTITGEVTVERFIPTGLNHGKSWQFLSVPVNGTQTIQQAWQENNAPLGNANPGYGTIITGNIPNATSLGFDIATQAAGGPGMKSFNSVTNAWVAVPNTNTQTIANSKGYMLFVRGDRSVTTSAAPATPTILRVKGNLYTASVGQTPPPVNIPAGSFESLGNPYASAIDFTQINKPAPALVDHVFYVWDPLLAGSQGLGGYQTISSVNNYKPIPGGTAGYHADSIITSIQSGQAFFMHATGAGGTVSFSESAKTTGSRLVHRAGTNGTESISVRTALYAQTSNGPSLADANLVVFHADFDHAYTHDDALKLFQSGENLGISLQDKVLSLEARGAIRSRDTIRYYLQGLRRMDYSLQIQSIRGMHSGLEAFLVDRFLNTETPVNAEYGLQYEFAVQADPASAQSGRFLLVFRTKRTQNLPTISIRISKSSDGNGLLQWSASSEEQIQQYIIERSVGGEAYKAMAVVEANRSLLYQWKDADIMKGEVFYRIQALKSDQEKITSDRVKIEHAETGSQDSYIVSPNPVQQQRIQIWVPGNEQGSRTFKLWDAHGRLVAQKQVTVRGDEKLIWLPGSSLSPGIYHISIYGAGIKTIDLQILLQ